MKMNTLWLSVAAFATVLAAQSAGPAEGSHGAPLRLLPSDPLPSERPTAAVEQPKPPSSPQSGVRPAILQLKPAGDPLHWVEEPSTDLERDKWRTYQRPKVDRFSRNGEGVAIQGYDVVSYLEKRAEKGRKDFSFEYGDVIWHFTTAEHRDQFRQDPERYLPAYGGFCSYSVGRGFPATADPRAFSVEGQQLYLFFDKAVQAVWEQDRGRLIAAADRYWPRVHR